MCIMIWRTKEMSPLLQKCFEIAICSLLTSPLTRSVCKMFRSRMNLQDFHVKSEAFNQMLSAGVWGSSMDREEKEWNGQYKRIIQYLYTCNFWWVSNSGMSVVVKTLGLKRKVLKHGWWFYLFIFTYWENTSCDLSFLSSWFQPYRALVFPRFPEKNYALTRAFLMLSLFFPVSFH